MALASPRQPQPVQQLTPPSSAHGGRGSWDFAVPLNNTCGINSTPSTPVSPIRGPVVRPFKGPSIADIAPSAQKTSNYDQKPFMSEQNPLTEHYPVGQPLASHPNGYSKPFRSDNFDPQRYQYEEESNYTASGAVGEPRRKRGESSANASDPDGAVDHHRGHEGKSTSRNTSRNRNRKKAPSDPKWGELEKDESNWIHRDKLKEIESRELIEAGFTVGRASRSNSRSQSVTHGSRERKNSEATTDPIPNGDDRHDRRMVSPIPAEVEEAEEEQPHWDLRTPEEIEADRLEWAPRNNHVVRPSTSRIPVAKISPAPVPHTFVERDAPLPRSRGNSANWSGDAIATNGARVRSGSVSSQVLLDEPGRASGELLRTPLQSTFSNPTSPVTGSPPKSKTPGRANPTSGARKTSAQRSASQAKPRIASATSPTKRPGTSGGSISRPTTGHRPEGEAPWIATMYKPDPRLPPDQQIIPTHAKRMKQEQWETEGKTGSMYDRDFRLLNTEEFKDKRNSQIQPLELDNLNRMEDDGQWPLPSPTKPTIDTNPRSPSSEQGGYKLTPTIPQSPRAPSRNEGPRPAQPASPQPTKVTRIPEQIEEAKEKKGCCCIVM